MSVRIHPLSDIPIDRPVDFLSRKKVLGAQMLVAEVKLETGCVVDIHSHESEQMSCQLSGKVLWKFGDPASSEYEEIVIDTPTIIELPAWFPHGVLALEDSYLIDILSPAGPMGVDRQGK